ncbi:uncharacterized mitochondrial protein AtMg00810-like [Rutidosis leptorrhynchoides]|uniref:uncharacterized mitochondrial protein AtMg00810-like n=1 Tax=Rutidosis leptorrhynchoides TaxID=125765 RepID=UPI003A99B136
MATSSPHLVDSSMFLNPVKHRQVVGALQYVTLSQLDITYVVNKVCQFMHAPTEHHWYVVKIILRYLHGTLNHGMLIRRASETTLRAFMDSHWKCTSSTKLSSLEAFSNADWAGCLDDRISMGGYVI